MRLFFVFVFLLFLAGVNIALAEETSEPPPPILVNCKSENNCDKTPAHLENFVSEFYRWYLISNDMIFSTSWHRLAKDEFQKRKAEHKLTENRVIKDMITSEFYQWFTTAFDEYGGHIENFRYCSPDINYFTCAQDIMPDWKDNISTQLIEVHKGYALLIVRFSSTLNYKSQPYPPHIIAVQLTPANGYWRIAGTNYLTTIY